MSKTKNKINNKVRNTLVITLMIALAIAAGFIYMTQTKAENLVEVKLNNFKEVGIVKSYEKIVCQHSIGEYNFQCNINDLIINDVKPNGVKSEISIKELVLKNPEDIFKQVEFFNERELIEGPTKSRIEAIDVKINGVTPLGGYVEILSKRVEKMFGIEASVKVKDFIEPELRSFTMKLDLSTKSTKEGLELTIKENNILPKTNIGINAKLFIPINEGVDKPELIKEVGISFKNEDKAFFQNFAKLAFLIERGQIEEKAFNENIDKSIKIVNDTLDIDMVDILEEENREYIKEKFKKMINGESSEINVKITAITKVTMRKAIESYINLRRSGPQQVIENFKVEFKD